MEKSKLIEVTDENIEEVISNNEIVLLKFWAEWCGPCKTLNPVIEELASENGDVTIASINIEEAKELVANYNIKGIPAIVILKNGSHLDTIQGAHPKEHYQEVINKLKESE